MTSLTASQIPCCLCGTMIYPNAANQCPTCLAQGLNLQDTLQQGPSGAEYATIHQCKQCRRFQAKPQSVTKDHNKTSNSHYQHAEMESPELLAICLKHIPALNTSGSSTTVVAKSSTSTNNNPNANSTFRHVGKLQLVDAGFIWTEPHSMRLQLHVTVRTTVEQVVVQQRVMITQRIQFQTCHDCHRESTHRSWQAIVQIRQKRTNVTSDTTNTNGSGGTRHKGLLALEMALAKNKEIRKHVLHIDSTKYGFDFYMPTMAHAQTLVQSLQKVLPLRIKTSKKLISTNVKNNTANVQTTVSCDMVPLCRHDLVIIHKHTKACKFAGRLVLVHKVSSIIHLLDASPSRKSISTTMTTNNGPQPQSQSSSMYMELSPETYYKQEKMYTVLQASNRLIRFVVLDVELCESSDTNDHTEDNPLYTGPLSGIEKYALADVLVARETDFGVNDETFSSVSHLGHLLQAGDVVLGYDLVSTIGGGGDWELEESCHGSFVQPDVVLVKKVSGNDETLKEEEGDKERKPRISKKKERRRRKEGKKMRELEESAARMGFLDDFGENMDKELALDPELAEEVAALERDFEAFQASDDEPGDTSGEPNSR